MARSLNRDLNANRRTVMNLVLLWNSSHNGSYKPTKYLTINPISSRFLASKLIYSVLRERWMVVFLKLTILSSSIYRAAMPILRLKRAKQATTRPHTI